MKNILILEDEKGVGDKLSLLIGSVDTAASTQVEVVESYSSAKALIKTTNFDIFFIDLLLLPADLSITDGRIKLSDGSVIPFSPEHWEHYVREKGGIDIVRFILEYYKTLNVDPIIVVTSYFDTLPGYANITRSFHEIKNVLFLPKFYKNPAYQDFSQIDDVREAAESCLRHVITGTLYDASYYADILRKIIFELRCRKLEVLMQKPTDRNYNSLLSKYLTLTWNFTLVIEIDPRGDEELDWWCSAKDQLYSFSMFYEDWQEFRNRILFNSEVKVKVWIEVFNVRSNAVDKINLEFLSPAFLQSSTIHVNQVRRVLRERAILAYLAFYAEPPQGLMDYGWTISSTALQKGCMEDIDLHPNVSEVDGVAALSWPNCPDDSIPLEKYLNMKDGKASIYNYIKELRENIDKELDYYYRSQLGESPISAKNIIVSPEENSRGGYFYNGDLRIGFLDRSRAVLPNTDVPANPDCNYHNVYVYPMSEHIVFECDDGNEFSGKELKNRLSIVFDKVKEIGRLEDLQGLSVGNLDVLVCAPIDNKGLYWWYAEVTRNDSFVNQLLNKKLRIILVPDTNSAKSVSTDVFVTLADYGVHCIYTKSYLNTIPEVKLIDAVLCTGPRVKYVGFHMSGFNFLQDWRKRINKNFECFSNAYSQLVARKALGDSTSGSASIREDQKKILITSSRTNKKHITNDDLAEVLSYSPSYNELRWAGKRRPSSSTPWHTYIYAHAPEIKAVLHTHNKNITYSEKFSHLRTTKYSGYGMYELGLQLIHILKDEKSTMSNGASVAILEGHGEVAVGEDLQSCVEALIELDELASYG